jgi:hypothetical protein
MKPKKHHSHQQLIFLLAYKTIYMVGPSCETHLVERKTYKGKILLVLTEGSKVWCQGKSSFPL